MLRWLGAEWFDREGNGSRKLLNHANEVSETLGFLPHARNERTLERMMSSKPENGFQIHHTYKNTRARRCACIFIRLAAIKASNCIIVSLDSLRRFILVDLSAKIIKHDHVVLNAQRVEQVKHSLWLVRTALQQRTRLARWGCRRSSSSQKVTNFLGALLGRVLVRSLPWKDYTWPLAPFGIKE